MGAMGHLEVMGTMGTRQGHLQRAVVTKHRHRKTETTRPSGQPDQKTQKKTIQYYVTHFSTAQVTTYCFSLPFSLTGL